VSSLIGIGQNQFSLHRCRKADQMEEANKPVEAKPVEVDVVRKQKKQRPHKKH
jgi:YidC/Oxa1 family membrane protein insertase